MLPKEFEALWRRSHVAEMPADAEPTLRLEIAQIGSLDITPLKMNGATNGKRIALIALSAAPAGADVFLDRLTGGLHHRLISGALPGLGRLVTPKTYVALKTTLWP